MQAIERTDFNTAIIHFAGHEYLITRHDNQYRLAEQKASFIIELFDTSMLSLIMMNIGIYNKIEQNDTRPIVTKIIKWF